MMNNETAILEIKDIQADFPILNQKIRGKSLIYLDNAATTQKPLSVINAMTNYYLQDNANVHRGVYQLCERSTAQFENARENVRKFINADRSSEIIFTRGATEAINLVATSFGGKFLQAQDEIIISAMEHHSNLVPWQEICKQTGAFLKIIPVLDDGTLDLNVFDSLLNKRTKMVAITHVSNALGTINPIKKIIEAAHREGVPVLIDGAQAVSRVAVDVQELDCDFYVFSSHKMYGPMGIGVLYGKQSWLEKMPPYQFGGDMIRQVSFEKTEYNVLPNKFEAGTPNVAAAVGLSAAIHYINRITLPSITEHEVYLTQYATEKLLQVPGLRIVGDTAQKIGVISFVMQKAHPHDIATILDHDGIAIRAGHHCAMPLMERFQVAATARISFGIYNDTQQIDALIEGLLKVHAFLGE